MERRQKCGHENRGNQHAAILHDKIDEIVLSYIGCSVLLLVGAKITGRENKQHICIESYIYIYIYVYIHKYMYIYIHIY